MIKRTLLLGVCLVAIAAGLAACGGDDGDTTAAETSGGAAMSDEDGEAEVVDAPHPLQVRQVEEDHLRRDGEPEVVRRLLVRRRGPGLGAHDGSTSATDWTGYWPLEAYPQAVNPPQGFLASANQQPVDPAANPRYLGASWYPPWRALREDRAGAVRYALFELAMP